MESSAEPWIFGYFIYSTCACIIICKIPFSPNPKFQAFTNSQVVVRSNVWVCIKPEDLADNETEMCMTKVWKIIIDVSTITICFFISMDIESY